MNIDPESYQTFSTWCTSKRGQRYLREEQACFQKHCQATEGKALTLDFSAIAPAKKLPYLDETFEHIILPHVLAFCSEPESIFHEAARLVQPEGCVWVSGFMPGVYLSLLSCFGNKQDKALAQCSLLSKRSVKAAADKANLVFQDSYFFASGDLPYCPLVKAGYWMQFKKREYLVKPLRVDVSAQPMSLMGTPSLALTSEASPE